MRNTAVSIGLNPAEDSKLPPPYEWKSRGDAIGSTTFWKGEPCVVVSDGDTVRQFYDRTTGDDSLTPIERAVLVARLRALADVIEEAR